MKAVSFLGGCEAKTINELFIFMTTDKVFFGRLENGFTYLIDKLSALNLKFVDKKHLEGWELFNQHGWMYPLTRNLRPILIDLDFCYSCTKHCREYADLMDLLKHNPKELGDQRPACGLNLRGVR